MPQMLREHAGSEQDCQLQARQKVYVHKWHPQAIKVPKHHQDVLKVADGLLSQRCKKTCKQHNGIGSTLPLKPLHSLLPAFSRGAKLLGRHTGAPGKVLFGGAQQHTEKEKPVGEGLSTSGIG